MSDKPRRRSGGRAANKRGSQKGISQMSWRIPRNIDRPIEPLTEDGILAVHNGAMEILENIGIDFLNEEAIEILREAGCKIEGEKVFFDRHWIMEMIAKAPDEFTITPRRCCQTNSNSSLNVAQANSMRHINFANQRATGYGVS